MSSTAVIYMGPVALDLLDIFLATAKYDIHMEYHGNSPRQELLDGRDFYRILFETGLPKFVNTAHLKNTIQGGRSMSLVELRLHLGRRDASEDLDQIYSLLGLFDHIPNTSNPGFHAQHIPASYQASVTDVYTAVSRQHLLLANSVLPLAISGFKHRYHDTPTWAIDWTLLQSQSVQFHLQSWVEMHDLFHACDGLGDAKPSFDADIFHLAGVHVDDIVKTMTIDFDMNAAFYFWYFLKAKQPQAAYPGDPQSNWVDAWYGTLCCDSLQDRSSISSRVSPSKIRRLSRFESRMIFDMYHRAALEQYVTFLFDVHSDSLESQHLADIEHHPTWHKDPPIRADGKPFDPRLLTWNLEKSVKEQSRRVKTNRVIFLTKLGYLGIANTCQKGDKVYVVAGGNLPIILRHTPEGNKYENVADCYLHGFMDGQHNHRLLKEQGGLQTLKII